MAWRAAISMAAATCSVSSSTRRQSRAAMVPMLTLSWLWHSVERENTLAGMVSFRASAVHADTPDLHGLEAVVDRRALATASGEVLRQSMVVLVVDQQGQLAVQQVGEIGHRGLQRVHGEGDVAAVEMPAVQHQFGITVDQRVVVGAVELVLDVLAHPGSASSSTPMTCGAQRIE
jgi:hypothetical protein